MVQLAPEPYKNYQNPKGIYLSKQSTMDYSTVNLTLRSEEGKG